MEWNEVKTLEVKGKILTFKDAMIMLDEDETKPDWPSISCVPGEYIFEINVPKPFFAHRARIKKIDTDPILGIEIGTVDIDHAFLGIIDYESFIKEVKKDYEGYSDWTAMELDDELCNNFSGEIELNDEKLLYVQAGDGDGTYTCYELIQDDHQVGIECVFIP